jgi:4-alpha-glucanotransferase
MDMHPAAKDYLIKAWDNRLFLEYEKDKYFPTWFCRDSRAYASLSGEERKAVDTLIEKHFIESEKIWEKEGGHLLTVISNASSMLPCAEDLGTVPACVPKVLKKLNIPGLRVVRWEREWDEEGQPYIQFGKYDELSVCTSSVHDSSTLREWWDKEADQDVFANFIGVPSLPKIYNPGTARIILSKIAASASRYRVFPIQDFLHLSNKWYAKDSGSERVNIPGTVSKFNWTWRLPATPEEISKDEDLIKAVQELASLKPV